MKKAIIPGIFILLFICTDAVYAEDIDSGQKNRASIFMGYDGDYINYREYVDGNVLDKDTGWLNGFFVQGEYDTENIIIKADFNSVRSDSAKYDGALQDGTPVSMTTSELINIIRVDVGYKAFSFSNFTLVPSLGIGYRDWFRGKDSSNGDYQEEYSWWFFAPGIVITWSNNIFTAGLGAMLLKPFSQKMQTDVAGYYDNATFKIRSEIGYRVELPVTWKLYTISTNDIFLTGTLYYERWNIGKSPVIQFTQSGAPTGDFAFEPESHTDMYGLRIGAGFNF